MGVPSVCDIESPTSESTDKELVLELGGAETYVCATYRTSALGALDSRRMCRVVPDIARVADELPRKSDLLIGQTQS